MEQAERVNHLEDVTTRLAAALTAAIERYRNGG